MDRAPKTIMEKVVETTRSVTTDHWSEAPPASDAFWRRRRPPHLRKLITVATMLRLSPIDSPLFGRRALWPLDGDELCDLCSLVRRPWRRERSFKPSCGLHGRNEPRIIREVISTATAIFIALAFAILIVFLIVSPIMPWEAIFNVPSKTAHSELRVSLLVLVSCFALSLPLSVTPRLQAALQEGYRANLWSALGSLLGLVGVWLAISFDAGLPWLAFALSGSPLAANLINAVVFFGGRGRGFLPRAHLVSIPFGRRIFRQGVAFLGLQIIVAINVASDNLIISHLLGPQRVTDFSIPERMFGLVPILIHLALQPLWPAYAEARARNDHDWVRKTLRLSFATALAVSITCCALLVLVGGWVVELWTGGAVVPGAALLTGLALWKIVDSGEV